MRNKLDSYLGFAKKSGNLVSGTNTCLVTMKKGKVRLLMITEDTSENTAAKLKKEAERQKIPYRVYGNSDELSPVIGESGRSVFGITDANFAGVILKEIDQGRLCEKGGSRV